MKTFLYLILSVLLAACSSTRKVVEVSTDKVDSISLSTATTVKAERLIDSTKTEKGRLVVTEIEFLQSDSLNNTIASLSIRDGTLNVVGVKGNAVKSIRQTIIEEHRESKGESRDSHEGREQKQYVSSHKENMKQTKQVSPAPDPYRWRYVFYLSLVILTGVLYFKRIPIINWIKKMLCGLIKT